MYGAELVLVDGLINDCAAEAARIKQERDCFDISTFKSLIAWKERKPWVMK